MANKTHFEILYRAKSYDIIIYFLKRRFCEIQYFNPELNPVFGVEWCSVHGGRGDSVGGAIVHHL